MTVKSRYRRLLDNLCAFGLAFLVLMPGLSGLPYAAAQSERPFKIRVAVDLTTVEVTALDKKGEPIHNLKKEDFQLYEDGKEQEIISIDEVNANARLSPSGASPVNESELQRGKTVLLLFIDRAHQQQMVNFKGIRDSAMMFVKDHMQPQDLFAVAAYGFSMKIYQNFTGDREKVLAAIGKPAIPMFGSAEKNTNPNYQYVSGSEDFLRSLEKISYSIARIKGRKSILIFGSVPDLFPSGIAYGNALLAARKSNVVFQIIGPVIFLESLAQRANPTVSLVGGDTDRVVYPTGSNNNTPGLSGLSNFATGSGGNFVYDVNKINEGLDKLDRQISNYYVLGFQSGNPKHDGKFRELKVRTKLKDIIVKSQPGYMDRRPIDVLASSKQEQTLMTAVASTGTATQLPIVFRPAYFYNSSKNAKVLVAAKISLDKVVFKKKGKEMGADLNIMGVAYNEDNSVAARFSETINAGCEKEKEPEYRKAGLAYRNYFNLRPGKYRLKLAVSDESNNLGSMEQLLEVPVFPDRGFAGSSLVIAGQATKLSDFIQDIKTQMLDETNPLLYAGVQIEPSVDNRLPAGAVIPVIFRLYNLPGSSNQWNLAAKAKLLGETGKEYALGPISLNKTMSLSGKTDAIIALQLSFPNAPAGKYRLIIETIESVSGESATLQTDLELGNISSR
jgi:VWFA-related protein